MTIPSATPNSTNPVISPEQREPIPILDKKEWRAEVDLAVTEALQMNEPISVLFIDADYFKEVNDTLGHEEGDAVIKDLRGLIGKVENSLRTDNKDEKARKLDFVSVSEITSPQEITPTAENELINTRGGHIGGDEFAILVHADRVGAEIVRQRLRNVFQEYIDSPDKQSLREIGVNVSIGIGALEKDDSDSSPMLRRADEDMYIDKLSHLPELTQDQLRALVAAKFILEDSGIRLRDVPKYFKLSAPKD